MKRLPILGLFLGLFALSLASCVTTPLAYHTLRITPAVLLALADIQDEFARETAWCLLGRVIGGTVSVEGMAPPIMTDRTETSAIFDCAGWSPVGFAHNHPGEPGPLCVPSNVDVASLYSLSYELMLISCDGGVFIYQFRGEGETYRLEPEYYGYRGSK